MTESGTSPDRDPVRDPARLAALRRLSLLDTPAEEPFDRLVRLAARLLDAPSAVVSLVDEDRQFFWSAHGVKQLWAARGTPLSHSFCQHVVHTGEALVVNDSLAEPLVRDNPAVSELNVAAYAGVPLREREGHVIGTLCVMDSRPRTWRPEDLDLLGELAATIMSAIELRAASHGVSASAWMGVSHDESPTSTARPSSHELTAEQLAAAADALASAGRDKLDRLRRYDQLVRSEPPTLENVETERRLMEEARAAFGAVQHAVTRYDETTQPVRSATTLEPVMAELLTRSDSLREASVACLQAHRRQRELDQQFRIGRARLDEFEQASADAARAEDVLYERIRTYDYSR